MERIINVKVSGNHLTKDGKNAGTRGEANATILRITFDEGWDGYAKSVVFLDAHGMNPTRFTLTTNLLENIAESTRIYLVPIPPSSLAVAGEMSFSIEGYIDGKRQRSVIAMLEVEDGIITDVIDDITPTQAEQLQAQYESIVQDIQQAAISRNEAEAFAENAKKSAESAEQSAQSAEQTKEEVETLKQETLEEVDKGIETVLFWKNDALSEIAGVKDGAISAIDTNKQQALSEMSEYKEEALEDVDQLVERAQEIKDETLYFKQDAETSAQRAENHFNKAKEEADKAEDAATRAKASADTAVLSAEQVEDYANRVIEVPEGEVAPQGIFEMEEGIYLLKGKFHYYPLDCDFTNETGYNPVIDFEREVIACITKSEGEEDYYGSPVYWERKHLWYFDATANNNTGSQVIITVKYNGEDDVYDNSFKRTPNKYLERSSFKQREIDDLFYSRLANEEGRTEWYPTLGVMADYVQAHMGELNEKLEPILLNEELEGILDGEIDLVALNEELETILEGDD